ncbi:MAG: hypothetical protein FWF11_02675 [Coriobacteriia bacterium]|nr:hypothetical protein [Coriobacteriia bacterium]
MKKNASTTIGRRYLKASTPGQRRAAFIAALLGILLLLAAIGVLFVERSQVFRPAPTTAAQQQYLRGRESERQAIAAAEAAGHNTDTFPAVVTARLNIARALLAMGRVSAAADLVDGVAAANPTNARAFIVQGNVHEFAADYERAIAAYWRALDLVQNNEPELQREALRGLGNSFIASGDRAQGLDMFVRGARIKPESICLHLAAAEVALDLQRWQDGAHHYYAVLFFDPDNETALEQLRMLERDHSAAAQAAMDALIRRMSDD